MKGFLLIDGQVEADFTPEKFFHLHDIDMSGAIDKQVSNDMRIHVQSKPLIIYRSCV